MRLARARCLLSVVGLILTASCAERQSAKPTEQWQLTETLRIGSENEGPTLFSWVKGLEVDNKGGLRVYEHSAQEIRSFDSSGAFVKLLGRKGAGPGELMNAEGIQITRDGRMWMRDEANGRFTIFDAAGDVESAWPLSHCSSQGMWDPKEDDAGRLLDVDCVVKAGSADGDHVLAYRRDLSRVDTLYEMLECGTRELGEAAMWISRTRNGTSYIGIPFAPRADWSLDGNGMLWCVPNSARYEVLRLLPGATDTLRVVRDLPAVPVTESERADAIADVEERGPTGVDFSRIPAIKPVIARIIVDDTRRLWVRRSSADGTTMFDVYAPDGTLVAEVHGGKAKFSTFAPFTVRGEAVYTVITDENDVPTVVRYRIDRLP
ncbi:MAG: hypothetical protein ACKVS7_10695 [Gemmatimonadaceae bacterium]